MKDKSLIEIPIPKIDTNDKSGCICLKMGADSLAENTPNAPKFINLSAQVQKF